MAVIKCKMCGGDLIIEPGSTVAECEYCGSRQTIPTQDNEKKLTLFSRANRLRMNSEFDKAAGIYENIVTEFPEEAEAYWGLVLCKYGIEYVDDPATGKKIPTCHRSSFDSVMEDSDFEQAMENADGIARRVYREEAKQIEEIRKGIIEVSGKEQPYDIFICYKETAEDGGRTLDSVLAQDVYDALTAKGYRVFFSRITLEDKLGQEYEPYIFAALNSARIMLAFGTDYEYYNAVWVKNEWSRYLKLMAKDKTKHLIPCYKNVDAYDMPKEFAKLQAQDLGKVGAIQDLLRGIEKILGKAKGKEASAARQVVQKIAGGSNADSLLERGFMSLEDEDFEEAEKFFDKVLNSNSKCAQAYLGLLMAEMEASDKAQAEQIFVAEDYVQNRSYQRAKKFAKGDLKTELINWEKKRNDRLAKEAEEARAAKEAEEIKEKKHRQESTSIREQLEKGRYELTEEQKQELGRLNAEADRLEAIAKKAAADYEAMPEQSERIRLEKELTEKRAYHSTLGFFKGKEKKMVQEQIASMETELSTIIGRLEAAKKAVDDSQAAAKNMSDTAIGYRTRADHEARKTLQRRLMELYGVKELENGNVTFGHYPQKKGWDNRDDKTPIEWQILAKENGQTLVISQYVLDSGKYNSISEDTTWEKCSLRTWLNETFLNNAFSAEEQAILAMTNVSADKNMWYDTNPGNSTQDKVFLLSMAEAEKYFKASDIFAANALRKCDATADAWYTSWWLRSPGAYQNVAAYVFETGSIQESGSRVDHYKGVRPALWINLDI